VLYNCDPWFSCPFQLTDVRKQLVCPFKKTKNKQFELGNPKTPVKPGMLVRLTNLHCMQGWQNLKNVYLSTDNWFLNKRAQRALERSSETEDF